jgi:glycosyltransferase involved in cell wall biosynthesis
MRILVWHGWLLEGSGSNIYTAKVCEHLRAVGHDVLLLCQEAHADRYRWIDAWGSVDVAGPSVLSPNRSSPAPGKCVLLRPDIGTLLPVFVLDEYEGFDVKTFVELTEPELAGYLRRNVDALRAAVDWHGSDLVVAGHAIPGPVVATRAVGPRRVVAAIHGSDIEYAMRPQARYRELAREGLLGARTVVSPSADALRRCEELVPGIAGLARTVPPGVDAGIWRPRPRREALLDAAERLEADPDRAHGRPSTLDREVAAALARRDGAALDGLAHSYDQEAPDPDAAARLRALADVGGPLVGYLGKLIPQKGVELLLAGARASVHRPTTLVVGFGLYREWLVALDRALVTGDRGALDWLREVAGMPSLQASDRDVDATAAASLFTGRLDHRYAPGVVAALDVLVVPSILTEAFGMVAAEGAAAGALPLVARHSGLAEVAETLETAVGRPGLFSFTPGPDAHGRVADGIDRLLNLDPAERRDLGLGVSGFVAARWSWARTAERLIED